MDRENLSKERAELAKKIQAHIRAQPTSKPKTSRRSDGGTNYHVHGGFSDKKTYQEALKEYQAYEKKWKKTYEELLTKDREIYDKLNKAEPRERKTPPKPKESPKKSKARQSVIDATKFVGEAAPIIKSWRSKSITAFDFSERFQVEGPGFLQLSVDFKSVGSRITELADRAEQELKTLKTYPEGIDKVRSRFANYSNRVETLLDRVRILLSRYNNIKFAEETKERSEIQKAAEKAAKDQEDQEREAARQAILAERESQDQLKREIDTEIFELEEKRLAIKRRITEQKFKKRGFELRKRMGILGSFGSRISDAFSSVGIDSSDERGLLGSVTKPIGSFVGSFFGNGVMRDRKIFKLDKELQQVNDQIAQSRLERRGVSQGIVSRAPSAPSYQEDDFTDEEDDDTSSILGEIGDDLKETFGMMKDSLKRGWAKGKVRSSSATPPKGASNQTSQESEDYNRTDDDEYLSEVEETNEILTDIRNLLKKGLSSASSNFKGAGSGLLGGLGSGLLAGGLGGLATKALDGILKGVSKLSGLLGNLAKVAISIIPAVLSSPITLAAVVAAGFGALLWKQMDQQYAPNFKDPKNTDYNRLMRGMMPWAGQYDYINSSKNTSTDISRTQIMHGKPIQSTKEMNLNNASSRTTLNSSNQSSSQETINNKSSQTDTLSQTAIQDILMKAAEFTTPEVIEDTSTDTSENMKNLMNFFEGPFLDKLIDGLSKVLMSKGSSGRSWMPGFRGAM